MIYNYYLMVSDGLKLFMKKQKQTSPEASSTSEIWVGLSSSRGTWNRFDFLKRPACWCQTPGLKKKRNKKWNSPCFPPRRRTSGCLAAALWSQRSSKVWRFDCRKQLCFSKHGNQTVGNLRKYFITWKVFLSFTEKALCVSSTTV